MDDGISFKTGKEERPVLGRKSEIRRRSRVQG
jgi:hypothetical protein